ncbi:PVC-type heme-binding CxxCH protein [Tundrisphaera sp. TA3]|uniref:PVC-type heme-binding CxxCH protein n=1 Tax=Tundrisphaera sp. TA3 TaxID=3435775 RepID=UPI003EBC7C2A
MNGSLVRLRPVARLASALVPWFALSVASAAPPASGMVDQGTRDPRLKGIAAPRGIKVEVVADEAEVGTSPIAIAFDDRGSLLVAGWNPSDRTYSVSEVIHPPTGDPVRVRRLRKTTTDVVRRLVDKDGNGTFEASEVVLEGAEMPAAIVAGKGHLLLACGGRLERWEDEDGDGRFEARTILADGFPGSDLHGLSGITPGLDGWLYLATGDGQGHLVGAEGRRIDVDRAGAIFRCRPDGSELHLFATGLSDPRGGLAFDAAFRPFLADDDQEDGSKFQGVRLISPVEEGDYGWRSRPDGSADFDRAAVDGERSGKLPVVARVGRGSPHGLVVYNGSALPEECRDLILYPDQAGHRIRGFKLKPGPGARKLEGETVLISGDEQFAPKVAVVGPDDALYVLDARQGPGDESHPCGAAKAGRIYRITRDGPVQGDPPQDGKWIGSATLAQLLPLLGAENPAQADRAAREIVGRGAAVARGPLLGTLADPAKPIHARLLGLQGARTFWDETVEAAMVQALTDPHPDVRRLAAQALAWEPKSPNPQLIARLAPLLADADAGVVREAVLAVGRHADHRPGPSSVVLVRRLFADPGMDPTTRDGYIRALERLGDAGVEELAVAVRTKHGADRVRAIAFWTSLRSAPAAERLPGLVAMPDLTGTERAALIRHYLDFPASIAMPTQGLADWAARHPEAESPVKLAVLDVCLSAGNPASALVLRLIDDEDEATRLAAIEVAARSRPPGSMARLAQRLNQPASSAAERLAIVRALGGAGSSAFPAIEAAYARASDDPAYAVAALRAMAEADPEKAAPAIEAALVGSVSDLKAEAIRILSATPQGAISLGKRLIAGKLGRDDLPAVMAALGHHGGAPGIRPVWTEVNQANTPIGDLGKLKQGGDPWRGLGVLLRDPILREGQVHSISVAGPVGPYLSEHQDSLKGDDLLKAIGDRSSLVGFALNRLTLKDGRKVEGNVHKEDDTSITLGRPFKKDETFRLDEVASRDRIAANLSPMDLHKELTTSEIADLVAFLRSQPARQSLEHGPRRIDQVMAIGPMEMGADKLRVPLNRIDPARALPGQDGSSVGWGMLEASAAGTFDLRGQFGHRPGRAYIAAEIRSESDQEAALRFASDGAARVYLNGIKVGEFAAADPSEIAPAFASPRPGTVAPMPGLARLLLKDGWNLVVVAIDRGFAGSDRAAFEVASPRPVEIRTPRPTSSPSNTAASPTPGRTR